MTRWDGYLYYQQNQPGFIYVSDDGWTMPATSESWKQQGRVVFEACNPGRGYWARRLFDATIDGECSPVGAPAKPTGGGTGAG